MLSLGELFFKISSPISGNTYYIYRAVLTYKVLVFKRIINQKSLPI
jgi:hypothetical protein